MSRAKTFPMRFFKVFHLLEKFTQKMNERHIIPLELEVGTLWEPLSNLFSTVFEPRLLAWILRFDDDCLELVMRLEAH